MNFENVNSFNSNDFEQKIALKIEMQKRFQKFKNQMKKIIDTHKKKFDNTMIEINSRIDKLLSIIKNKKTIIVLKNQAIESLEQKLTDKSKKLIKETKNDKQSIDFETKNDVFQIDTKKAVKMIVLFDSNEFTEKSEFRIDD